jgi:hypothetical protein
MRLAVLAAVAVVVLAACGTSSPDPLAPKKAFTAADQRTARNVEVRQSDVPPVYRPRGSQQSGRQKCAPDLAGLTLTAVDRSRPYVERGAIGYVLGEVDLYETASQGATAFRKVTAASRLHCLLGIAHSALSHFVDGRLAVGPGPLVTIPAGSMVVGRRFAESWRDTDGTHTQTTDDVYLLAGRTIVILSFFGDRGVFPAAAETRAIERVLARALGSPGVKRTRPGGNTSKGE